MSDLWSWCLLQRNYAASLFFFFSEGGRTAVMEQARCELRARAGHVWKEHILLHQTFPLIIFFLLLFLWKEVEWSNLGCSSMKNWQRSFILYFLTFIFLFLTVYIRNLGANPCLKCHFFETRGGKGKKEEGMRGKGRKIGGQRGHRGSWGRGRGDCTILVPAVLAFGP